MHRCKLEAAYVRRNMVQYFVLLLFLTSYVGSNSTLDCEIKEKATLYLDFAVEMINRAKSNLPLYSVIERNDTKWPVDCADNLRMGQRKSGVYTIRPINRLFEDKLIDVYCDMDTDGGGWTVIQRRGNYGNPNDYFFREWKSYKEGFGNMQQDFWLGNDNIFALTNQKLHSARFDLKDVKYLKAYALYDYFWIDDEFNNYTLHAEGFSGNAGDSLNAHNKQKFSTKDVDNDEDSRNCAVDYKGAWWYYGCHKSNLNGLYLTGENSPQSVSWYMWKTKHGGLESTEIKIRPKNFMMPKDFTKTPQ